MAVGQADALLVPTTPWAAPRTEKQWKFQVGGKDVTDIFPEHASIELRRRARDQPSDGPELGRASTRPRVVTVICSPWLDGSNELSGACRDSLGSQLQARRTYGPRLSWDNKANEFNAVDISGRTAMAVFPGKLSHVP